MRKLWTAGEVMRLRRRYADEPTDVIARDLGRPLRSVYHKARSLGLHKSDRYYQVYAAGRLQKLSETGKVSRFKPGQKPWNKGTHFTAGGRSAETRFKPGRKPQESRNYLPIGTTRMHKSDYLEKKVSDDLSVYPAKRWKAVHRLVWEAEHGPVPQGHVVVFKPGAKTVIEDEITLDRLEMITRAENMRRNSYHTNYPPELRQIVQLQGALNRKIRNREERDEQDHQRPA